MLYKYVTTVLQYTMTETTVGHTKGLLAISRILLGVAAIALFSNCNGFSAQSSAEALIALRYAKFDSARNMRWSFMASVTLTLSLVLLGIENTVRTVDSTYYNPGDFDDQAPTVPIEVALLKMFFVIFQFYRLVWASMLSLMLIVPYFTYAAEYN